MHVVYFISSYCTLPLFSLLKYAPLRILSTDLGVEQEKYHQKLGACSNLRAAVWDVLRSEGPGLVILHILCLDHFVGKKLDHVLL